MLSITTGPVLEMGMGNYSTPILHEMCKDRLVVSLDSVDEWVEKFAKYRSSTHKIKTESNWDNATHYLQSVFWDVVLIDQHPCERRIIDLQLLMHNTRFFVVHDTEPRAAHVYNYEPTLSLFRYRWELQALNPYTTVVSMTDPIPMSLLGIDISDEANTINTTPKEIPKLSILIATLDSRTEERKKLISTINSQCKKLPNWESSSIKPVEIIELSDNGEMILGNKRNMLLQKASGQYLVFIDDDDSIADSYIEDILKAIDEQHPDCITFKGIITTDGKNPEEFKFDMNHDHNTWHQENGVHLRCPSLMCPIKSSIAKTVKFLPIYCAEDRIWAIHLYPLLNTQIYIDKHLYFYKSSTTNTSAQQEEKIEMSRKIMSKTSYIPYVRNQNSKIK
jgi:hypothetical protein